MSAFARGSRLGERRRDLAIAAGGRAAGSASPRVSRREHLRDAASPVPGTLYVVATPIGNLEDITLRALRVLREVALVAAEDTRRTSNLLRHYGIQTPQVSLHEHNEHQRIELLLSRLRAGQNVALVSDAGTPGISDPGALLVRAARDAGMRVDPIPGASAITAALSASGLAFDRFAFAGFSPIRSKDRNEWLDWIARLQDVPVVCFEAPHRIRATLARLAVVFGNRPIVIARELTKAHEQWFNLVNDLNLDDAGDVLAERGEFVIILAPGAHSEPIAPQHVPPDTEIAALFGQITAAGSPHSRRATIKAVADRLGVSPRTVFDALERAKRTP